MNDVEKLHTRLIGFFDGASMTESLRALSFARKHHKDQTRRDGTPYIVHPMSMACYAIAIGIRDDNTVATILLHDVVEDCGIPVEHLPFNSTIKDAVRHMTIQKLSTDKNKIETKCRYFSQLLDSKEALICKALDRYNNLSDATTAMSREAVGKNVAETEVLLLPVLRSGKEEYTDLSNTLYALRVNLEIMVATLKSCYREEYEQWKPVYEREDSSFRAVVGDA